MQVVENSQKLAKRLKFGVIIAKKKAKKRKYI